LTGWLCWARGRAAAAVAAPASALPAVLLLTGDATAGLAGALGRRCGRFGSGRLRLPLGWCAAFTVIALARRLRAAITARAAPFATLAVGALLGLARLIAGGGSGIRSLRNLELELERLGRCIEWDEAV